MKKWKNDFFPVNKYSLYVNLTTETHFKKKIK